MIRQKNVTRPMLLFLFWALFSLVSSYLLFGITAATVAFFYWLRLFAYSILAFFLAAFIKHRYLQLTLTFTGLTVAFVGILQYILYPDIRSLQVAEWDPHYYRVVGTLLDPGFIGIILVLFLIFLISKPLSNKIHQLLTLSSVYIVLSLTYSRSSYLALLGGAVSFSIARKSWKPFVFTLILLTATVFLLPRASDGEGVKLERTNSIVARIENWGQTMQIIATRPVLGVGYNAYRYAQKQSGFLDDSHWLKSHSGAGADSSLLFIAATTGMIGLLFYLFYLSSLFKLKFVKHSLAALLVHSLFLNSLVYPFVLFWLSCLIAFSITGENSSRSKF